MLSIYIIYFLRYEIIILFCEVFSLIINISQSIS